MSGTDYVDTLALEIEDALKDLKEDFISYSKENFTKRFRMFVSNTGELKNIHDVLQKRRVFDVASMRIPLFVNLLLEIAGIGFDDRLKDLAISLKDEFLEFAKRIIQDFKEEEDFDVTYGFNNDYYDEEDNLNLDAKYMCVLKKEYDEKYVLDVVKIGSALGVEAKREEIQEVADGMEDLIDNVLINEIFEDYRKLFDYINEAVKFKRNFM